MPSPSEIATAKQALRRNAQRLRSVIPASDRNGRSLRLAAHSDAVAEILSSYDDGSAPRIVSGFMPFGEEIDPWPLMTALARRGARLALPRIDGPDISFRLHAPGAPLIPGVFGIGEPDPNVPTARPDLMLVPLLAFDRSGARIGYGRGYYDRAIARLPGATAIGLAFAAQEVARVPVEPHDRRLDFILTEDGLIDCRS